MVDLLIKSLQFDFQGFADENYIVKCSLTDGSNAIHSDIAQDLTLENAKSKAFSILKKRLEKQLKQSNHISVSKE
nr:MAG TPA: hypothetical protein [Caudoviricetes sp.]